MKRYRAIRNIDLCAYSILKNDIVQIQEDVFPIILKRTGDKRIDSDNAAAILECLVKDEIFFKEVEELEQINYIEVSIVSNDDIKIKLNEIIETVNYLTEKVHNDN